MHISPPRQYDNEHTVLKFLMILFLTSSDLEMDLESSSAEDLRDASEILSSREVLNAERNEPLRLSCPREVPGTFR